MSKPLVFFGNERLATGVKTSTPVLRALLEAGYDVRAVITSSSDAQSRNKTVPEIVEFAENNKIKLIFNDKTNDLESDIKSLNVSLAVLVAYGQILPQKIIDLFTDGIVNIHPSLLPKYRGSSPIEQAILDKAKETGVSLMKISDKPDGGPIYAQIKVGVDDNHSKQSLANKLNQAGAELLREKMSDIINGTLEPKPQDESLASETSRISKSDGMLNLDKPAKRLEAEVVAYAGWPKSRTKIFGQDIVVTKAKVVDQDNGDLVLKTADRWLQIEELIAPSGKTMSAADFIRGYKKS